MLQVPQNEKLIEELRNEYYPKHVKASKSRALGNREELPPCKYPAVYLMTRTVKEYKALVTDPEQNFKEEAGKKVALPDEALKTTHTSVIPARYRCIQCLDSFTDLSAFHAHIRRQNHKVSQQSGDQPPAEAGAQRKTAGSS